MKRKHRTPSTVDFPQALAHYARELHVEATRCERYFLVLAGCDCHNMIKLIGIFIEDGQ